LRVGIDIGSTTVKVVVLDSDNHIVYKKYQRHHSKSRETAVKMLTQALESTGGGSITAALSGSAALSAAGISGLPFVQEVFATRVAVESLVGDVDAVVELGGEDAKILFITGGSEERMNGSCAGGTGAFIDQMASLLSLSLEELDRLSLEHLHIYNIASRCGVFAKSDIQPLLNQGAIKADIAASIYQSIVSQTIAGLAQGREIKGRVCFLGGPLTFLKGLRRRFVSTLELGDGAVFPENAEFFVAIGAALEGARGEPMDSADVLRRLSRANESDNKTGTLRPLFASEEEYAAFSRRHAQNGVPETDIDTYDGDAWLGIDAGSTTTKLVLIDENDRLLYSFYAPGKGDPLSALRGPLLKLLELCAGRITLRGAAVTGYGEELIQNAFNIDFGIVETTAHYYAAKKFDDNVDFIIDIGGQDMKCFKLRDGVVDSIMLNEACSSGCGSFIESFASALGYSVDAFARLGLFAKKPVNLGSRCTVFMNSSVKQAQNDGAGVDDISAGLSVSVVKNAVYKVIRAKNAAELGRSIVVQGGTFLNDSILRAFELEIGRDVTRPAIAGLMGAFGAALYAKSKAVGKSGLIGIEALRGFSRETKTTACGLCANGCKLTVNIFNGGKKYISGNRCGKPLGKKAEDLPDSYEFKKDLLLSYTPKPGSLGKIGLPLGLGMYELLPFWHTLLSELGFEVVHSGLSDRELYISGQHTIPSDTVCYPAKLMHGHIERLLEDRELTTVFFPCMPYNFDEGMGDNHYNCPVVAFYPELLAANVSGLKSIKYLAPYMAPHARSFPRLAAQYFHENFNIKKGTVKIAVQRAFEAYEDFKNKIYAFGDRALEFAETHNRRVIILAGRPYHTDPEVHHGVNRLLSSLGVVVISEDCLRPQAKMRLSVLNQWTYHSRLYAAAKFAAERPNVDLVQLISFGCGLDAITSDEVKDILENGGKIYTLIKIDEINNLGAAKIRLRSLLEAK
jgi:predicted CoA-substrate-specific enzyme activase